MLESDGKKMICFPSGGRDNLVKNLGNNCQYMYMTFVAPNWCCTTSILQN